MLKITGYSPVDPVVEYRLKQNPELFWKFKRSTWGDEASRDRLMSRSSREIVQGKTVITNEVTYTEVYSYELWLTFGGSNISMEDGKPFITPGLSFEEFRKKLEQFPLELIDELILENWKVNPHWARAWVKQEGESEPTSEATSSADVGTTES